MELMTSWERKGRTEGRREGRLDLVKLLLKRRLGVVGPPALKQIDTLSMENLARLAEALLDFKSPTDLQRWLARV